MIYISDVNFVLPDDFNVQSGTNTQVTKSGNVYTVSSTDTITTLQNALGITITDSGTDGNHNYTVKVTAYAAMPSENFVSWTLPNPGQDAPEAPADGYVIFEKHANTNEYVRMWSNLLGTLAVSMFGNQALRIFLPVRAGEIVTVDYTASGTTGRFGFVYAQGSL